MSTFALLLLVAQLCLVQNVYGRTCWRNAAAMGPGAAYAPGLLAPTAYADPFAIEYGPGLLAPAPCASRAPYGLAALPAAAGAYGGEGLGDIAIIGELPVAGTTVVGGQVPIMGAVQFGGDVPAAGSVTIVGSCGWRPDRAYY